MLKIVKKNVRKLNLLFSLQPFSVIFSEAMRLISDIKNDHFEPINFIQVNTNKGRRVKQIAIFLTSFSFQFTALNSLKRWSEFNRSSITSPPVAFSSLTRQNSPFPYRDNINARFILWEGDISLLNADGITNSTNENLSDINCITNRIFNRAGSALVDELKSLKGIIKLIFQEPACRFIIAVSF